MPANTNRAQRPANALKSAAGRSVKSGKSGGSDAPAKPRGDVDDFVAAAECLKALAHPARLRIVQLLLHARFTVGELAQDCRIADNVASEHLRLLQRCGFLDSDREGRSVYYRVTEPHLKNLMACVEGRFFA